MSRTPLPSPPAKTASAETRELVRRAGLRHASDETPGLTREPLKPLRDGEIPKANAFRYRDAMGRLVRDADALARIRHLAIPPAWQQVWISADADGHLQATGRDARGRKQYRYHAAWQAGRGETKFDAMRQFGQVLPRIRRRVEAELSSSQNKLTHDRVLAALVRLLDTTWLRIGNVEYARSNRSYGFSTLRRKHVGAQGNGLRLAFKGKSGVQHEARITDRRVVRLVRRCQELPGQALFQYVDDDGSAHKIDSADVNDWLADAAGTRITAKDFRTWHGSVLALELTLAACVEGADPCKPTDVLRSVAKRLGNTPAVCKKAYIHPQVLTLSAGLGDDAMRSAARAAPWAVQAAPKRGLMAAERRLLAMLGGSKRKRGAAGLAVSEAAAAGV
ncbi:MAG: DNA topoisomerase IB [Rubrivivax sp.]